LEIVRRGHPKSPESKAADNFSALFDDLVIVAPSENPACSGTADTLACRKEYREI